MDRRPLMAPTPLALIPGRVAHEQLHVSLVRRHDGSSVICLRQQHWAEGIGWYDQKVFEIEPGQLEQLQAALGLKPGAPRLDPAPAPATVRFAPGQRVKRPARRTAHGT